VKQIEKFRKCAVMGQVVGGDTGGGEDDVNVKIVQVGPLFSFMFVIQLVSFLLQLCVN